MSSEDEQRGIRKRRITLPDGRYMIFYTFEDKLAASTSTDKGTDAKRLEPDLAVPQAEEEERLV
ncbi:MAG: hypothetical protein H0W99_09430 [Acidobacteria bacterium]|nr:hypothetical protein [Acidobacteriota bacterium]